MLTKDQKKTLMWIGLFFVLSLIALFLFRKPLVKLVSQPETIRAWVEERGIWGRAAYMGLVFIQVIIALIPGEPFEIAAGYVFGAVEGTILCMVAAGFGSLVVFLLVRVFGARIVHVFFDKQQTEKLKFLKTTPGRDFLYLLIFMLPGTPKDLLSYFVGLTDMKVWIWCLISSFGRLPSIITSTMGGDALGNRSYLLAAIVFFVTLLISGFGLLIYRKICRKHEKRMNPEDGNRKE